MEVPFDPVIPLLGIYPKNPNTPIQKNFCAAVFIVALFITAKCWEQNGLKNCGTFTQWNTTQQKRRSSDPL